MDTVYILMVILGFLLLLGRYMPEPEDFSKNIVKNSLIFGSALLLIFAFLSIGFVQVFLFMSKFVN